MQVLIYISPPSVSIGKGTVVEYCILESNVTIGNKSIVSNLHLPSGTSVPDSSFLHTIPLAIEGRTFFATFAFGEVIIIPVPWKHWD